MKIMTTAVICLAASFALADDTDTDGTDESDTVDLRISVIENIDVTAEKAPAASDDEYDADIEAIIEEAEALESDETEK